MANRSDVLTGAELLAKVRRDGELLTVREVAELFRVDPKTPSRWDREGKLKALPQVSPGAHRRWRTEDVRPLLLTDAVSAP